MLIYASATGWVSEMVGLAQSKLDAKWPDMGPSETFEVVEQTSR